MSYKYMVLDIKGIYILFILYLLFNLLYFFLQYINIYKQQGFKFIIYLNSQVLDINIVNTYRTYRFLSVIIRFKDIYIDLKKDVIKIK